MSHNIKPGVATGDQVQEIFRLAKSKNFALPAVNVIGSSNVNAVLETAKELNLNSIIRFLLALKRRKITKQIKKKSAYYKFLLMEPSGSQLTNIKTLVESQLIKPVLDKEFSFSKSIEALLYQKSGRAKGKVIIKVK